MIELRLLGTLHLTDAAGREVKSLLTRPRRLALLAYLAAAIPRGLHRRDTLLALFWPELDQEHARAALRQALHVLRGALGDAVVTRGDEDIGLDRTRVWCDVVAFEDAIAATQFEQALELYRGDLLDGFFSPEAPDFERWQERERSRLRDAAAHAAESLVTRRETDGDLPGAIAWARRAAHLSPHAEEPLRRLVTLLDRAGDRAGAVAAYERFAEQLRTDLDAEPAAETKALLSAVRARDAARPAELWTPAPRPQPRRRHWLAWASVVAIATAGVGLLWPSPRSPGIRSLAVLPIENLSGDSLQSWFADGMTEALITDLGRISALRVASRGAVAQVKRAGSSPREIGAALDVSAYVEGAVQRAGDRVRVDLRLIDAGTGYQLWAGRVEEPLTNRFAIEDIVTRRVVTALHVPLSAAEERDLRAAPTTNPEAYDLYLRGRIRLRHETRADLAAAIAFLHQAVDLDPQFAAAHAQLAQAYDGLINWYEPNDTVMLERAHVEVDKALQLDPDLGEAHATRAVLLWGTTEQFRHEDAIREDRRALALNPNLGDAHRHLGMIFLHIGLLDEAANEFRRALALNPFDANAQRRLGIIQIYRGQYAEGLATIRQVGPESNPALWSYQVAWALLYLGRRDEAAAFMEQYLQTHPEDDGGLMHSTRAILRAQLGDARGAEADVRQAMSGRSFIHFHHSAYNIASAYAILGRAGPAVVWLRRAADEGWPCYPYFANDPNLAPIRQDQRYITFMEELKARWERYLALS